jgi:hypothetical protein
MIQSSVVFKMKKFLNWGKPRLENYFVKFNKIALDFYLSLYPTAQLLLC